MLSHEECSVMSFPPAAVFGSLGDPPWKGLRVIWTKLSTVGEFPLPHFVKGMSRESSSIPLLVMAVSFSSFPSYKINGRFMSKSVHVQYPQFQWHVSITLLVIAVCFSFRALFAWCGALLILTDNRLMFFLVDLFFL